MPNVNQFRVLDRWSSTPLFFFRASTETRLQMIENFIYNIKLIAVACVIFSPRAFSNVVQFAYNPQFFFKFSTTYLYMYFCQAQEVFFKSVAPVMVKGIDTFSINQSNYLSIIILVDLVCTIGPIDCSSAPFCIMVHSLSIAYSSFITTRRVKSRRCTLIEYEDQTGLGWVVSRCVTLSQDLLNSITVFNIGTEY